MNLWWLIYNPHTKSIPAHDPEVQKLMIKFSVAGIIFALACAITYKVLM